MSSRATDLASALAERFPALGVYCPILPTVSPPQAAFLLADNREAFYGGAVGGGKSAALLMAALQYVDVPGYRAVILRRTFAQLSKGDALIPLSHEWLAPTDARWNEQRRTWTFPSGATLEFGHLDTAAAKFDYQGAAFAFIGFDELTQLDEETFTYIAHSRARRRKTIADVGVPIRVRATGNPGGVGHLWVRKRFITKRPRGVLFVPAKVWDNPGLDVDEYVRSLEHLPKQLQRQLLDGDWDAQLGAALPEFGQHNLVDRFELQPWHERIEGCDFGFNGVAWLLLISDDEDNYVFADSLAAHDLVPAEVASLVTARRKASWGFGHPAWMDPSVWHRTGTVNKFGQPAVLADEFTQAGVAVSKANNDPRAGLARLRTLIKPDSARPFPAWHPRSGELGSPRLFVVAAGCPELVEQLQAAPLQPIDKQDGGEKIDPDWESRYAHHTAAARYAVMAPRTVSTRPDREPETDAERRTAYLKEVDKREQERWENTGVAGYELGRFIHV